MALRRSNTQDRRPDYLIPSDREHLIPWLEKRRTEASSRQNDIQMRLNLAYMLGHQTVLWDPNQRRLRRATLDTSDPNPPAFVSVNKIGGIVERTVSKLTKNVPIPECRPVSSEEDDISAARVGSRILDHELSRMDWESQLTRLYFWVIPVGWAYLYVCWDPEEGAKVGDFEDAALYEGEIKMEVVPPFELLVDPNARAFEDARWCIRSMSMTKEAVYETYGKVPEGAETGYTLADEVISLSTGYEQGPLGRTQERSGFVFVHQFWMRPGGRSRREGMICTWAGKEFLEPPKSFPYEHGMLPFVQFDLLPGQGSYEGRTWVSDLVAMQKDYNDARSREATLRRIMVPHLVGPVGSFNSNQWSSRVSYLQYNQVGNKPEWMVPDNRWAYQHEQAMNRSDQEMGERAGQAEVSKGNAPAGAPAAAILALQEADDTKLAVSARLLARGVQRAGTQVLNLVRQYWMEDRLVRTWSEESNRMEVRRFSGADISRQLDVHISTESALPRSKSARAQLVMDLLQRVPNIFPDPRHLLRLLQMPGTDWLSEYLDIDTEQARRENDQLLVEPVESLPAIEVAMWHNHMIHVKTHDDMRKGVDYEKSPPEIRARIDAHCDAHYQALGLPTAQQARAATQAAAQMGAPPGLEGAPGGGGQGPEYLDPLTGMPSSPLDRAAGMAPPASELARAAGIGGTGEPGAVPGFSRDQQAAAQGD